MARKHPKHGPREDLHPEAAEVLEKPGCWLCGRPTGATGRWPDMPMADCPMRVCLLTLRRSESECDIGAATVEDT